MGIFRLPKLPRWLGRPRNGSTGKDVFWLAILFVYLLNFSLFLPSASFAVQIPIDTVFFDRDNMVLLKGLECTNRQARFYNEVFEGL